MKKIFLIFAAAVALSSCATTAKHEPSPAERHTALDDIADGW